MCLRMGVPRLWLVAWVFCQRSPKKLVHIWTVSITFLIKCKDIWGFSSWNLEFWSNWLEVLLRKAYWITYWLEANRHSFKQSKSHQTKTVPNFWISKSKKTGPKNHKFRGAFSTDMEALPRGWSQFQTWILQNKREPKSGSRKTLADSEFS